MFTKAGDKACDGLVRRAKRKILGKKRVTEDEMYRFAYAGMRKIAEKHPEVDDTEPRYHISRGINTCLKDAGYGFRIQFSF